MYKFLIADDHPLFREAIVDVIQLSFPDSQLQQAHDLHSALEIGQDDEEIDLVLLDLNMPGMAGLDGLADFRKTCPTLPVVIISADEDKAVVLRSISEGAVGYITKSSSRQDIAQALEQVLEGNVYLPADILRKATVVEQKQPSMIEQMNELDPQKLATLTRRQLIVLERIANGESNKMIAYNLNIAETTVKAHVSAILRKLDVNNRIQAALVAGKVDFNSYLKR